MQYIVIRNRKNKDANPTVRILTACLLVAEWLKE